MQSIGLGLGFELLIMFNNFLNKGNHRLNKKASSADKPETNKKSFEVKTDDEKEWPSLETAPQTPYIADEAKFRKVVANVPLIKTAIEQHYSNSQEEKKRLSFKQALTLAPPLAPPPPQEQKPLQASSGDVQKEGAPKEKEKKKRRRSKSKSKGTDGDKKELDEDMHKPVQDFDLNQDDFPDLAPGKAKEKEIPANNTSGIEAGKLHHFGILTG